MSTNYGIFSSRGASLDIIRRVSSANRKGPSAKNWSVCKETDGTWSVRCCGDIMAVFTTENAAKAYYRSMTSL